MNFILRTTLENTTKEAVLNGFTKDFFLKLAPPFPRLTLLQFDGSEKGNEIHLELNMFVAKKKWISLVTENGSSEKISYFIDEGNLLPPPLKYWQHRHILHQSGTSVIIEDNVTYSTKSRLLNAFLLPFFYLLFLYRKPIYKKKFSN